MGRFITADTTVPYAENPQALNRYSYAGNNPINHIEDGYGWFKKFINGFGSLFGLIGGVVKGAVTGDWSTLQNMATATASAFIMSWGNPVATLSAFAAVSVTESDPGKKFIKFAGDEIFDDALGMRPRTAYIWSSIATNISLTLGFESMFANITANPAAVKNTKLTDREIEELRAKGQYIGDENTFGPSLKTKGTFERSDIKGLIQDDKLVGSIQRRTLDIPFFKQIGAQHISANALNVSSSFKLNPWTYATWGVCHQATNLTLLNAGISSTILDLAPSWDMYVTTAVYGNYGGQLGTRILSGINANRDYERRQR